MYGKEYRGNVQETQSGQRWTERKSYHSKEMNKFQGRKIKSAD